RFVRRALADAEGNRNGREGLAVSGRPVLVLCPRPDRTGHRAALHRAQRRDRGDHVHLSRCRGTCARKPWAVEPAARNRGKPASGQAIRGRHDGAGATAIDPGFRGDAMRPERRFGAELNPDGVTFRLWAPTAKRVELMLDRPHPMQAVAGGWYEAKIAG